tara:strand:+ start:230 stop:658 length:429 start_codon:yes stop_codon:yes gene_type:complete
MVRLFTIGYTKKSAEEFFGMLKENKIEKLIDIRESNTNVYAGYTMKQNLPFFLSNILGIEYIEMKTLAPTKEIRKIYHEDKLNNWHLYEDEYIKLLDRRDIKSLIDKDILDSGVLLCSEPTTENATDVLPLNIYKSSIKILR